MRVVLDTNVLVSGIFWAGNPHTILCAWKERKFDLCESPETISEFVRVLKDFKIQMPEEMIREWVNLLAENAVVIKPAERHTIVADPKDNTFIDCAVAARADYLVSGDKKLLRIGEFKGTRIVSPHQFVEVLG